MLLSKRRLWSCNQALHLEKIKKYNKRAKWIWNQSGLWWQCSDSELLSCLCIPDLEGYLQSMPLDAQKLLNPHLRGKISNVQHPVWTQISGATFSWQVSHWPRHLFLPPLSWDSWFISWNSICSRFFFQICCCTKEAREKKQLCWYQQELLQIQIQICAPAWRWVTGDLSGEGIPWNIRTLKLEGWMILGVANQIPHHSPVGYGITPDLD